MRTRTYIALILIAFVAFIPSAAYAGFGGAIVAIFGFFTGIAGWLLNTTIDYTILKIATTLQTGNLGGIIEDMWKIVRDLVNLTLVFGLLYAGFQTIVKGIDQSHVKEILKNIIICALLVNFSLIFTKVIIDVSNSASVAIFNEMIKANDQQNDTWNNYGISGAFMQAMGLSTFLDASGLNPAKADTDDGFMFAVVGIIFMIIAAFVFFAGAIMLMTRFAVLILLLIFSPILFAASAFKQTAEWRSWWIKSMTDQAIFPPVYLFMLWISYKVVYGLFNSGLDAGVPKASLSSVISTPEKVVGMGVNNPVFGFILGAILLIASLIAAKKAGAVGGDMATKFAGRMAFGTMGALGRATVGNRSYTSYKKNEGKWNEYVQKGGLRGIYAQGMLAATKKGATSSYDVRATKIGAGMEKQGLKLGDAQEGGYEAKRKAALDAAKSRADSLGKVDDNDPMVLARKAAAEEAEDKLEEMKRTQKLAMDQKRDELKDLRKTTGVTPAQIAAKEAEMATLAKGQRTAIHLEEEKVQKAKEAIEREKNRRQIGTAATAIEEANQKYKDIQSEIDTAKHDIELAAIGLAAAATTADADLKKKQIEAFQKTLKEKETAQREFIRTSRGGNIFKGTSNGYADVTSFAGYHPVVRGAYALATGSDYATLKATGDNIRKEWKSSAPEKKSKKSGGGHSAPASAAAPAAHPPAAGGHGGHP